MTDPRLGYVQGLLAKNPDLRRNHFIQRCGIAPKIVDGWVNDGLIVLGKPHKRGPVKFFIGKGSKDGEGMK